MKRKILVIDDMESRHTFFEKLYVGEEIVKAWDYHQAIEALNNGPYDVIQFDHDLGHRVEGQNGYVWHWGEPTALTGQELVRYLIQAVPEDKWPKLCIVHTMNPDGAKWMMHDLRRAGIPAERIIARV